uniref:Uncharacterized protein n=1 Tax=Cajanus cajan TaxID=3821 RepID=A0A151QN33_CAJCA|nr:hypothetical protein KK1_047818 [Cajanus cajan]
MFQEVTNQDPLIIYCMWEQISICLPYMIQQCMIKTTKQSKVTSSIPYGIILTKDFDHFKVLLYLENVDSIRICSR